ncbi:uncharacterized protein LOC143300042 [Babylonia areolata]|uniref:uncharacterized protein LOC143300042 n=1 Tax=Babylonia areolata TaxID=304850 RepID=UPI003FD230C6
MAWKVPVLILVLAMASSALCYRPRFRFRYWLPTNDNRFETGNPTSIVYASQERPSDRPSVRRFLGIAGSGAASVPRGPENDVTSAGRRASRDGNMQRILQIRSILERIAESLRRQHVIGAQTTRV